MFVANICLFDPFNAMKMLEINMNAPTTKIEMRIDKYFLIGDDRLNVISSLLLSFFVHRFNSNTAAFFDSSLLNVCGIARVMFALKLTTENANHE